jgi:ADP-ribosyl-[dinitrogen reductase] hydrolase
MRTSLTHPLYISWVPFEDDKGCLGLTLCPGKYQPVSSTGSWDRQLEVDIQSLVVQGVTRLISLITDEDMAMLRVQELPTFVWQYGLEWHHLPLVDTTVPTDEWMEQALPVFETLMQTIPAGEKAVVHCMGGLSRAGTFASLFLWMRGMEMSDAIATIREKRSPHAINWRQEQFLHEFASNENSKSAESSPQEGQPNDE